MQSWARGGQPRAHKPTRLRGYAGTGGERHLSTLRRGRPRRRAGFPTAAREDRRGPRAAGRAGTGGRGGALLAWAADRGAGGRLRTVRGESVRGGLAARVHPPAGPAGRDLAVHGPFG